MLVTKEEVLSKSVDIVLDRINQLENELSSLKESAASDTKSSMGDKYETGREMINLEKAKISEQLKLAQQMLVGLKGIDAQKTYQKAELGALVITDSGRYFLSVALGQVEVKGTTFFAISMASPLAQQLIQKGQGDVVQMAGKSQHILEVS